MNETETRAELIDPALAAAGWGVVSGSRVRREYVIAPGCIEGRGRRAQPLRADYLLEYRNTRLAVIEAKAAAAAVTEGLTQAKDYAAKLAVRYACATNGHGLYRVDMQTGAEGEIPCYPTPDELWAYTFASPASAGSATERAAREHVERWRDRFAGVPFEDKGGSHPGRYYQDTAIERVLAAVSDNKKRILLTLATGTGKTFIAFQIAWKLFHSRWNLSGEPTRRPRILFLADRNIVANQAYNAFSAFEDSHPGSCVRIKPEDIRKKGAVPKNGSLFFTIFQTTLDYYTSDDTVVEGEIETGKVYDEPDFNRNIEIREREKKRVEIFMAQIDQSEKTLVFCATQAHALLVRDLINQLKTNADAMADLGSNVGVTFSDFQKYLYTKVA